MGEEGHNFCGKRTFTNVIFDVQISQIKASEDIATATSTLDVLYPALMGLRQYISAWAIELLILGKAMREPYIGISEVEHPRLSV